MHLLAQGQIHDTQCVSPCGEWVVFDNREAGMDIRHATAIRKVNVYTGEVVDLFLVATPHEDGPGVAAATFSPDGSKIIFIHGIRPYGFASRFGMVITADGEIIGKRDRAPLQGGTHAHTWHPNGAWISCTYNDDRRTVAVLTETESFVVADPWGGEYEKAFDECWLGHQPKIAFQGIVDGKTEVFIADLSAVLDSALPPAARQVEEDGFSSSPYEVGGGGPGLPGTEGVTDSEAPLKPPQGITIRRLTYSAGIQGVRHWLRADSTGEWIACLMHDERGISQVHLVDAESGEITQLTDNEGPVDAPICMENGKVAYSCGGQLCVTDMKTRETSRTEMGPTPINGVAWAGQSDEYVITNRVIDGVQWIVREDVPTSG